VCKANLAKALKCVQALHFQPKLKQYLPPTTSIPRISRQTQYLTMSSRVAAALPESAVSFATIAASEVLFLSALPSSEGHLQHCFDLVHQVARMENALWTHALSTSQSDAPTYNMTDSILKLSSEPTHHAQMHNKLFASQHLGVHFETTRFPAADGCLPPSGLAALLQD
jgi:hypothetical protein